MGKRHGGALLTYCRNRVHMVNILSKWSIIQEKSSEDFTFVRLQLTGFLLSSFQNFVFHGHSNI